MKSLNEFARGKRAVTVIAFVWLAIAFVLSLVTSGPAHRFPVIEFLAVFVSIGVIPTTIVIGLMWILAAPKKSERDTSK